MVGNNYVTKSGVLECADVIYRTAGSYRISCCLAMSGRDPDCNFCRLLILAKRAKFRNWNSRTSLPRSVSWQWRIWIVHEVL
jgi:hypothetical protein